jgi:hypothetical protein
VPIPVMNIQLPDQTARCGMPRASMVAGHVRSSLEEIHDVASGSDHARRCLNPRPLTRH